MRKVLAIVTLFSYMLCAFGVSFSFHHCGGEFKYLSLNDNGHEVKCCKGKNDMADDCCKSNKVICKKTDDKAQSFWVVSKKNTTNDYVIEKLPAFVEVVDIIVPGNNKILLRPPPLRTGGQPLYLLNSVFRI